MKTIKNLFHVDAKYAKYIWGALLVVVLSNVLYHIAFQISYDLTMSRLIR